MFNPETDTDNDSTNPYTSPNSYQNQQPTAPTPGTYQDRPPTAPAPGSFQNQQTIASTRRPQARGLRTGAILLLTLLLAVVFGTGLFAGWEFGRSNSSPTSSTPSAVGTLQPGNNLQPTIPATTGNNTDAVREAVITKVRPSVVEVAVATARGGGLGSGVVIDKRGYIVTNNHVVQGAQSIQVVLYDGTKLPAQVTGTDATDDLAVVKINPSANLNVITIGDSSQLRVGQSVLAVGNPLGITQTVTSGIVSALNRSVNEGQGGATLPNAIQTDAPINPGNSGGALVDMQGNLVGIPTLTAIDPEFNTPANGVGFAIPSNRVKFIAPQIIANGQVTHTGRAGLNVQVVPVDPTLQAQDNLSVDHGAMIGSVTPNGAAAHAGLQAGDIIVQLAGQNITDSASLGDALANKNPGENVTVKIVRGNQQLTINVTLGELQAG